MRFFLFVFISLFLAASAVCQNYSIDDKKAISYYQKAELLRKQRQFPQSIELYKKAIERSPSFAEAHLRLAFIAELYRDMPTRIYHLEQVASYYPEDAKFVNVYYLLATSYFDQGQYDQSTAQLAVINKIGIGNIKLQKDVEALQRSLDFAREAIASPLEITPEPLKSPINGFPLQYFPVLSADNSQLFFTRRLGYTFAEDEDIYVSTKNDYGQWQIPESVSPNINSRLNEGACSITADGRILVFTSCEGRRTVGGCDLYMSQKVGDEWSPPVNMGPNINSRKWDSQPAISADGTKIYFISDRLGGYGKKDIWFSEKDSLGNWKTAKNVGPVINTPFDEVSPFIHVNNKSLYFSSNGYPSLGGYDIYYTQLSDSGWQQPKNIGYPINTHSDEVSLFVASNGKEAYYSYETYGEQGAKSSQLYKFELPEELQLKESSIAFKGIVMDKESNEPLLARVSVYEMGSEKPMYQFVSDSINGRFLCVFTSGAEYAFYIEKEGYLFLSEHVNVGAEQSKNDETYLFQLSQIKKSVSTVLNNLFFDFDSYELRQESETELNKLILYLTSYPTLALMIEGHTDDRGTEEYNLWLSEKRAESVYNFLINNGISENRLNYQGFGESRPIHTSGSEEHKAMNRRINIVLQ